MKCRVRIFIHIANSEIYCFIYLPFLAYHLVVICSIENEDKSNMVASLDQFRRQFPAVASMGGIKSYLKRQLVVSGAKPWESAATVDMEK